MKMYLSSIRIDGNTQARVALNEDVVAEYAAAIEQGAQMPPVVVFFDGTDHWLGDGYHRVFGYRKAGQESIPVEIRTGTRRDAILYACGANGTHGLRRTNDDKRKAVTLLVQDEEWGKLGAREIAKLCGVHHDLVYSVQRKLSDSDTSSGAKNENAAAKGAGKKREKTEKQKAREAAEKKAQEEREQRANDANEGFDATAELETLNKAHAVALADLKALQADDVKAELAKERELTRGLNTRNRTLTKQIHEMDTSLQRYVRDFKELRQLTGTESNKDAMAAVRKHWQQKAAA